MSEKTRPMPTVDHHADASGLDPAGHSGASVLSSHLLSNGASSLGDVIGPSSPRDRERKEVRTLHIKVYLLHSFDGPAGEPEEATRSRKSRQRWRREFANSPYPHCGWLSCAMCFDISQILFAGWNAPASGIGAGHGEEKDNHYCRAS